MNLPSDNSICKGCGEIFSYHTDACPTCHSECMSLDEYKLGKAEGFHGGEVVKWFACIFMLVLVGLVVFTLSRHVGDERLLGARDQLQKQIGLLTVEEKSLNDKLEPARQTIAQAEAVKSERERLENVATNLAKRERAVELREAQIDEREHKIDEIRALDERLSEKKSVLTKIEEQIRAAKVNLGKINGETSAAKADKEIAIEEKKSMEKEVGDIRKSKSLLEVSLKSLTQSLVEQSQSWTNVSRCVVAFEEGRQRLMKLRDLLKEEQNQVQYKRGEYVTLTNAIVQMTIQRDMVVAERKRLEGEVKRLQAATNDLASVAGNRTEEIVDLQKKKRELVLEVDEASGQKSIHDRLEVLGMEIERLQKKLGNITVGVDSFDKMIEEIKSGLHKTIQSSEEVSAKDLNKGKGE